MQWNMEVLNTSTDFLGWTYKNISELGHVGLLITCQLNLDIGHIDLFSLLGNCSLLWTQKVLQTMGIVFPCQPLSLVEWVENSIHFRAWRLNFYA